MTILAWMPLAYHKAWSDFVMFKNKMDAIAI
jgi:hypothetical protein